MFGSFIECFLMDILVWFGLVWFIYGGFFGVCFGVFFVVSLHSLNIKNVNVTNSNLCSTLSVLSIYKLSEGICAYLTARSEGQK